MSLQFYTEIFKFRHLRGCSCTICKLGNASVTISWILILFRPWSAINKHIHFERKMYIFSPFFFKSQIQCHSFRELFLSYTTKILLMALYHLIPSISFVVHIAPRKLIIYLLLSLPPPIPLAVEHTIHLVRLSTTCTWSWDGISVREDTYSLSGWCQILTANRKGEDKTATEPLCFM